MSYDNSRSVGRYRLLNFLGAGPIGEVYFAEDPHIERKLAIKTVRLMGQPQEVEDRKKHFLREARAAGRLLHPNVVTLFDAGEAEGLLYLASEFVEGTDLASRLEKGLPNLREALRIVRQAADALHYAHGQGIVHRDIKPSNILLDPRGRVKVADFGITKMATELTMAVGNPQYLQYLSPEQIRGEDLDGRSDIFSLGVVLYELLSGNRPFSGETISTLVYQILHKEPPRISELRAVPPRLEALLGRMLAKDRDQRLATAAQVAVELAEIEKALPDDTSIGPAQGNSLIPAAPPPAAEPDRSGIPEYLPLEVYQGTAPYMFVSYAHEDLTRVYPDLADLHKTGIRIWYDEGISPGAEWSEEIARAIDNCHFFVVFISTKSVVSRHVLNEIRFALDRSKPFLAIHLEEAILPLGLQLRMGDLQALHKWRMQQQHYRQKLVKALPLALRGQP